ncbi:MAG: response regulator [Romboutsia sp.]|uniref:response regulator n=1 Tax=Romboutsia sp. TaxID=1965302 RepID=UPI003F30CABE
MHKVYLLDDEPMILEGLRYIIPWEEYGFEIVGSAKNGQEGYEEIINKEVDLIVSDIMMPKMTGLELIERLKKENYKAKFIVMSAFQEFEYAKKAIEIGAENYLLKPIDEDELSNNIKNIQEILRKESKQKKERKLIENNYILDIFKNESIENIDNKLEELGVNTYSEHEKFCAVIVEVKNSSKDIEAILSDKSKEYGFLFCVESNSKAVILLSIKEHKNVIEKLTDIKNEYISNDGATVYISIGRKINKISELNKSYKTAEEVSEFKMVYPNISWIKEYKEENCYSSNINKEIEEIKDIIMDKNYTETLEIIKALFAKVKEESTSPKVIKLKAIEIFLNVYNYFNDSKIIKGLNEYLERVINKDTVDDIEDEVINMIMFMQSKLKNTEESISPIIIKLLQHIEKNYKNDLNLKEISEKLNVNAIYLGQLFQKETGILFSDYINNFRVNRAKELLIDTSLKASEIGDLVGYANKNYFYRKFKDLVGITPSEWRKINI